MADEVDVILLRSADEPDRYLQAFEAAGLRAVCEPVLQFTFPNRERLRRRLSRRGHYAGLIATSPRVGRALERVFSEDNDLAEKWRGAVAYVVGPKTASALQSVGLQPFGQDAGRASDLADFIIAHEPDGTLLFLCGNRRRDVLPNRLSEAGVSFEEIVVYETHTRTDLALSFSANGTWLVFFSPSGIEAVRSSASVDGASHRLGAIGPTTAGALRDAGFEVHAVAEEPSPEALVAAIREADRE